MRIAYIATSPIPSRRANALQVMKVCSSLVGLGHTVELWVPGKDPGTSAAELQAAFGVRHPVPVHWIAARPRFRHYDFSLRAYRAARAWGAELYYVRPLQAASLASLLGSPTLLDLHDRPHGRLGPWLLNGFLQGRGARRLVMTTHRLRGWLLEHYRQRFDPPFALVEPNGVDIERYERLPEPEAARAQLGWKEAITASYTGQLYQGRGLSLLADLATRNPDMAFVWAGGDPESVDRWRRKLDDMRLDNTRLLGFVPNQDLPRVHAASDILLMPYEERVYLRQGDLSTFYSPMKLFEYMAAGRAILSSDLPALREILHEGNAILLPPEDVEAWDRGLKRVAADPALRRRLGQQSKMEARSHSWQERSRRVLEGIGD
jgi:glycosyltransferase involved in cell wall biosynthesis